MEHAGTRDAFLLDRIYRIDRIMASCAGRSPPAVDMLCMPLCYKQNNCSNTLQRAAPINEIDRMEQDNFRPFAFSKTYPRKSRRSVMEAVSSGCWTLCQAVSKNR